MKKILMIIMTILLTVTLFVGCDTNDMDSDNNEALDVVVSEQEDENDAVGRDEDTEEVASEIQEVLEETITDVLELEEG